MARGQEYFLTVLDKRYKASSVVNKSSTTTSSFSNTKYAPSKGNTEYSSNYSNNTKANTDGFRRLTLAEITEKKQKGLCFHCDQKYEPGHDCRKKKLYMILDEDSPFDDSAKEDMTIEWEDNCHEEEKEEENEVARVSLHAMAGTKGACTLKVQGQLQGRNVSILIDSGSTHNFMSQNLAKQLQLSQQPCSPFSITVANGEKLNCDTLVKRVE